MKIGIVSDTHRNVALLDKVVAWMAQRQRITTLYHLGDDYNDVVHCGDQFAELVQIPGIYHEKYLSGELPGKTFETILGITLFLVHSLDKDATDNDINRSDIILYGHTHRQEMHLDDGKLYLNPGHLKGPIDKTMSPSFAILDIHDRSMHAAIYNLDFKPIQEMELIRSESGLYRAG